MQIGPMLFSAGSCASLTLLTCVPRPCPPLLFCSRLFPLTAQYTVKRLLFKGDSPYTVQQLQVASGIQLGQQISPKELADKAQQLTDTRAFADIDPFFNGSSRIH